MSVNFEPLLSGCLCLMYLAYALFVKGGFWKSNWTGKDGSWVSSSEGSIFFPADDHSLLCTRCCPHPRRFECTVK